MFVDRAKIEISSGKGGNGAVSFSVSSDLRETRDGQANGITVFDFAIKPAN